MKYLIVGTGRSGTGFMSKLLTMNGIGCGHERVLRGRHLTDYAKAIASTPYEAESSWLPAPHLDDIKTNIAPDLHIIQITRHPIKVIKSFVEITTFTNKKNKSFVPFIPYSARDSMFDVLIQYYISWYRYIEKHAEITLNIDDFDYDLLSDFLGRPLRKLNAIVNPKTHAKIVKITWEEVEQQVKSSYKYPELKILCDEYGFDI
jgi:hypothetical protein